MKPRVGLGYDVHRLTTGRPCVLGGILFQANIGPDGHSDGDVVLHAICDALLGAAGLRDIGHHFPNTDPAFKNADSTELLSSVVEMLSLRGYAVGNIDVTIISEVPKIGPKVSEIKDRIARLCNVEPEDIGVKATTAEQMGFVGRGEGIEAFAVAMIFKNHTYD